MEGRAISLAVPPALQSFGSATFTSSLGWLYALPVAELGELLPAGSEVIASS